MHRGAPEAAHHLQRLQGRRAYIETCAARAEARPQSDPRHGSLPPSSRRCCIRGQPSTGGAIPLLGVRAKTAASAARGKWAESDRRQPSKFGLSANELVEVVEILRSRPTSTAWSMLHFHIGSQITGRSRTIKDALREARDLLSKCTSMGARPALHRRRRRPRCRLRRLTAHFALCSMNYTLQEYANDVVHDSLGEACDERGCRILTIVTEAGRALVAHHAGARVRRGSSAIATTRFTAAEDVAAPPTSTHEVAAVARDATGLITPTHAARSRPTTTR